MSIDDIVNVQITRETKSVSRKGFGVTLVLGISKAFTGLQRTYSSQKEVLIDFNSTDKEAIASNSLFAQSPSPIQVVIGRRATSDLTVVTITTILDLTTYTVTINGTLFSFTSDGTATDVEIVAGLKLAVDAGSEPVTFTDNIDGTYDITPTVPSTAYSIQTDVNQTMVFVDTGTMADDLTNISQENDDWYAAMYTLRIQADVEAMATYIESVKKIFGTASSDSVIIDSTESSDITSISYVLKSQSLARSFVIYHSLAATQFPEAGLFGTILPLNPGSYTAAYQELSTITVDNLTSTQRTNALAKNTMIYTEVGGANITEEGKVAEGEFIDIIIFVDWIDARITEGVYGLLVRSPKVPYTDAGIASIEAEINRVLQDGQTLGGITLDPGFSISVPLAADVSAGDKAARTLNNVTFEATLTGAIHIVNITGTVTL